MSRSAPESTVSTSGSDHNALRVEERRFQVLVVLRADVRETLHVAANRLGQLRSSMSVHLAQVARRVPDVELDAVSGQLEEIVGEGRLVGGISSPFARA